MQVSPHVITAALRNGRGNGAAYGEPVNAAAVVAMLAERIAPRAQSAARTLLRQMAAGSWKVVAGIHQSASDGTPHITVDAGGRRHLRLDRRGVIFDITTAGATPAQRRGGWPPPWSAPGAAPPRQ